MIVIAIGGEPGSGKTTLMKKIIETLNPVPHYNDVKLVPYLSFEDSTYILGKYEDSGYAQGTDRMSMACQPAVIEWMKGLNEFSTIIFEGDRLFNQSFLEHCHQNYDLKIIYLKTEKETRQFRYKERGSEQNEVWLSGRETKVQNILSNLDLMFVTEKFNNNNLEEQKIIEQYIIKCMDNHV